MGLGLDDEEPQEETMTAPSREDRSPQPATVVSEKRSALIWYAGGTILLALYLGMAAGLSKSPVVGTLIPLLFSLLGGAGGLYLAKVDLEDHASIVRTKIVGIFVVLVALSVTTGSIFGIALRTGVGLRTFIPSWSDSRRHQETSLLPDAEEEFIDPALALELGALRLRLRALGFTGEEENRILQSARVQLFERIPHFTLINMLRKVAVAARKTSDQVTGAFNDVGLTEEERELARRIWGRMDGIAEALDIFAGYIERGVGFNLMNLYGEVHSGLEATRWVENVLGPKGSSGRPKHFLSHTDLRERARELRLELLKLNSEVSQSIKQDWMSTTRLTERIDSLIKAGELTRSTGSRDSDGQPHFEVGP